MNIFGTISIVVLLALSFLLSGLEAALLSVDRARIRSHVLLHSPGARRLEQLFLHRTELLVSILILTNALNVIAFALFAFMLAEWLGPVGYLVCFLITLPLYVIWFELVPKTVFQHFPFRSLQRFVLVLNAIQRVMGPLVRLGNHLLKWAWKGSPLPEEDPENRREALRAMTSSVYRDGVLDKDESGLIQRVLDFESVTAQDIMLPLKRVTSVPLGMPANSVVNLAQETGFDQFPVMSLNGNLVGTVRIFDILHNPDRDNLFVRNLLRQPVRTEGSEKAIQVLQRLRLSHVELAIVSNQSGRALGIVSSHDIVKAMMSAR